MDLLTNIDNCLKMNKINETDWKAFSNHLFIQVKEPKQLDQITQLLNQFVPIQNKARQDFIITGFKLVPLKDVGDNTREIWSSGLYPGMHPASVTAPPIMALLILLIASFNFANTAISATGKR